MKKIIIFLSFLLFVSINSYSQLRFFMPIGTGVSIGCPTCKTFDPANKGTVIVLSSGNLIETVSYASSGSRQGSVRSTGAIPIGSKICIEVTVNTTNTQSQMFGVDDGSANLNVFPGSDTHAWSISQGNGIMNGGSTLQSVGSGISNGDIITIAVDNTVGVHAVQFYRNGIAQGTAVTLPSSTAYYISCGAGPSSIGAVDRSCIANFGQSAQIYPIAGYTFGF